jgi:pyruvate/2-oxoglutarate dehydrogenase complex dihydrolipoamide dehydrogenase (E3) component
MNKQEEEKHAFDLIVIGTGTAASTAASECSSAGWGVVIIDSHTFGGTYALCGCDPKSSTDAGYIYIYRILADMNPTSLSSCISILHH